MANQEGEEVVLKYLKEKRVKQIFKALMEDLLQERRANVFSHLANYIQDNHAYELERSWRSGGPAHRHSSPQDRKRDLRLQPREDASNKQSTDAGHDVKGSEGPIRRRVSRDAYNGRSTIDSEEQPDRIQHLENRSSRDAYDYVNGGDRSHAEKRSSRDAYDYVNGGRAAGEGRVSSRSVPQWGSFDYNGPAAGRLSSRSATSGRRSSRDAYDYNGRRISQDADDGWRQNYYDPGPSSMPEERSMRRTSNTKAYEIKAPRGIAPGSSFSVKVGDKTVKVKYPRGVRPGEPIRINVPDDKTGRPQPRAKPIAFWGDRS